MIHRVGDLDVGDQIVFVGVSSAHRGAAFQACEFIMDYLKTKAPFWKKERVDGATRWVESRNSDQLAAQRWEIKPLEPAFHILLSLSLYEQTDD